MNQFGRTVIQLQLILMGSYLVLSETTYAQNRNIYPGFLDQSAYDHWIQYYSVEKNSPEYVRGSDPVLIRTILRLETYGVPWQTSRAGALGPAQMLLPTAKRVDPYATRDALLYDVGYSIKLMCIHTVELTREIRKASDGRAMNSLRVIPGSFKEKALILAAYNAGLGSVVKYGGIPPYSQTRDYVTKGMSLYKKFRTQREWRSK